MGLGKDVQKKGDIEGIWRPQKRNLSFANWQMGYSMVWQRQIFKLWPLDSLDIDHYDVFCEFW